MPPKSPDQVIVAEIAALAADTKIPESQRKRWQGALDVLNKYQFDEDGNELPLLERMQQYQMDSAASGLDPHSQAFRTKQFNIIGISVAVEAAQDLGQYPNSARSILQAKLIANTAPILADNDRAVAKHDPDRKEKGRAVILQDDEHFSEGLPRFLENAKYMQQTILDDLPKTASAELLRVMDAQIKVLADTNADLEAKKIAAKTIIRVGDNYKEAASALLTKTMKSIQKKETEISATREGANVEGSSDHKIIVCAEALAAVREDLRKSLESGNTEEIERNANEFVNVASKMFLRVNEGVPPSKEREETLRLLRANVQTVKALESTVIASPHSELTLGQYNKSLDSIMGIAGKVHQDAKAREAAQEATRETFIARQQGVLADAQTYLRNPGTPKVQKRDDVIANYRELAANARRETIGSIRSIVADGADIQRTFSDAIQMYSVAADLENGIYREYVGNTLIRDARNLTADTPTDHLKDDFARQFLNAARTSAKLCEMHGKAMSPAQMQQFTDLIGNQLEKLATSENPVEDIKKCNATLMAFHCHQTGQTPADAEKEFKQARDYMNFQDRHYDLVTLSTQKDGRGNPRTVVEADVMVKELTPQQRAEYEGIANGFPRPAWFKALPKLEQELLTEVAGDIAAGTKSIPTQLLDIAGTRNAWVKSVAVTNPEGTALRVVNETAHCGALYSTSKNPEHAQHIANDNARQLKAALGGTVHVNTLNSPTFFGVGNPFSHEERDIVPQTRKALEGVGGIQSGTPFNFIRNVSRADHDGFEKQLGDIAGALDGKDNLKAVKAYLEGTNLEGEKRGFFGRLADKVTGRESTFDKALAEINAIPAGDPARDILRKAAVLRRDIDAPNPIFRDGENHSLKKATTSAILASDLNEFIRGGQTSTAAPDLKTLEPVVSVVSCKSGKDRTGVAMFEIANIALVKELGVAGLDERTRTMANTGHEQHRAGEQGATLGNRGIQSTTRDAVPDSWGLKNVLNRATANFNKGLKYCKEKYESFAAAMKAGKEETASKPAEPVVVAELERPLLGNDVEMQARTAAVTVFRQVPGRETKETAVTQTATVETKETASQTPDSFIQTGVNSSQRLKEEIARGQNGVISPSLQQQARRIVGHADRSPPPTAKSAPAPKLEEGMPTRSSSSMSL